MNGRWAGLGAGAAAVVVGGGLLANNNFGVRPNRVALEARLQQMLENSRDWVLGRNDLTSEETRRREVELQTNPALIMMVADCAHLSGDAGLKRVVDSHFSIYPLTSWSKLVDPGRPFKAPDADEYRRLVDYQRWFFWAMAPDKIQLSPQEKADLESPDRMGRGRLTHQLMAWVMYRKFNGGSPEVDKMISHLAGRVAGEAQLDFRITDMYLQRVAFLLYAGRPDLVRPRWVERVIAGQQNDGGWTWAWFGWGPPFFQFRGLEENSSAHPTVQGMWIAHILKYRYPDWVTQHYL